MLFSIDKTNYKKIILFFILFFILIKSWKLIFCEFLKKLGKKYLDQLQKMLKKFNPPTKSIYHHQKNQGTNHGKIYFLNLKI